MNTIHTNNIKSHHITRLIYVDISRGSGPPLSSARVWLRILSPSTAADSESSRWKSTTYHRLDMWPWGQRHCETMLL